MSRRYFCIVLALLLTVGAGMLVVILPLVINWLVFLVWAAFLLLVCLRDDSFRRGMLHAGVMLVIVAAAFAAPVKREQWIRARELKVPAIRMTLEEIEAYHQLHREWIPTQASIASPPEELKSLISFPAEQMTVGEFIVALESQSTLRHCFSHCGNGSSILFGGDCCFGLHFRSDARVRAAAAAED